MADLRCTVNGEEVALDLPPNLSLADFLRERLRLTALHLGCEHGVCGACTVLADGVPVRSCLRPAVSFHGLEITTLEGLAGDPQLESLRAAFGAHHALQCGYCTPGMLIAARDILRRLPEADEARIREELAGNICRCTGYQGIVDAVAAALTRQSKGAQDP